MTLSTLAATPARAATTGSVTGTLTHSDGTAATSATVRLYNADNPALQPWGITDDTGRFSISSVPAGSYLVEFSDWNGPTQFYHQKTRSSYADEITVTAGGTSTVNEQLLPTGTIRGQLLTATGEPASDMWITAREVDQYNQSGVRTDSEGRFSIPVFPGRYVVYFEPVPDSYQRQYVPQRLSEDEATRFDVAAGQEVVVDEDILPTGSLSGRLTTSAGAPLANARVDVRAANAGTGDDTVADSTGEFRLPQLLVGSYTMWFSTADYSRSQYFDGKLTSDDADPVTVRAGEETRVTDSLLPTGSVRVTALDSVTGAPVADFCVESTCSNGTGQATVTGLPAGEHRLFVNTEDQRYFHHRTDPVVVQADQTTEVTVRLRPAARITTTVVDRATGAPVAKVCLVPMRPKQIQVGDGAWCTDENGRATLGPLEADSYRLFAIPRPPYGRQFVGATGDR